MMSRKRYTTDILYCTVTKITVGDLSLVTTVAAHFYLRQADISPVYVCPFVNSITQKLLTKWDQSTRF